MHLNKITSGSLIIAGTCIGAGMLALPVSTAPIGFALSLLVLVGCWALMYFTGLLTLEANLLVPADSNFISMAKATLGKMGEVITWLSYVLLLYSLMAAYLSGGGSIVNSVIDQHFTGHLPIWLGPMIWAVIVGVIVFLGAGHVDGLNRLLMFGLIAGFLVLIGFTLTHVDMANFSDGHPKYIAAALTVVITSFGYHVTIPGLRSYLKSDTKKLKRIILIGSMIPLLVYFVWMLVVFGNIPTEGANGLMAMLKTGQPATGLSEALAAHVGGNWVLTAAEFFVFFAIASSFLGIAYSLFDFVSDWLKMPKNAVGRISTAFITFIPPLVYASYFPQGFIVALSYGGIFVAILHGILPALMVWRGRKQGLATQYQSPGKFWALCVVLALALVIIMAQLVVSF